MVQGCGAWMCLAPGSVTHGLAHLRCSRDLESLEVCGGITDTGTRHLASLPALTSLNLSQNLRLTDDAGWRPWPLSNLQRLNLSSCKVTGGAGCTCGGCPTCARWRCTAAASRAAPSPAPSPPPSASGPRTSWSQGYSSTSPYCPQLPAWGSLPWVPLPLHGWRLPVHLPPLPLAQGPRGLRGTVAL